MFDRALRPLVGRALAPAAGLLRGLPPGALTAAGLGTGLAAAAAAATGSFGAALALWLANRLLDGLDGAVARAARRASDGGGYLDLVADVVVYAALPLGVATGATGWTTGVPIAPAAATWAAAALLLAAYYVNMASLAVLAALLEKRGRGAATTGEHTALTMPPGLVEGTETIVLVSLLLLLPAHAPATFALVALLVLTTAAHRTAWGARALRAP